VKLAAASIVVVLVVALSLPTVTGAAASRRHWIPPQHLTWYWQLQGRVAIKAVQATDFDGFDNSATTVAKFHAQGQHAICYIDVGTWEKWRPDAHRFPASVLGRGDGWPGERWLDIRRLSVLKPIMTARFQMCRAKGFNAVEPDNLDGWENRTGFRLTGREQLVYDEWVARTVHSLGMAVFQKGDPDQSATLEPYFDGALDEQCHQYHECYKLLPYLRAHKPVLDAEYRRSLYPGFCAWDNARGIMGALYNLALNGSTYRVCW
jgi:hypothetical protein